MSKKPAPTNPEGISFPSTGGGERSTTIASKNVFSASIGAVDPEKAKQVQDEENWRYKYVKYIIDNVKTSLRSPDAALKAARAGLENLHNSFEFIRDGKTYSLQEAMKTLESFQFRTGFIKGQKSKPKFEYEVPYKGKILKGEELLKQVKEWADYGTIEPSAAEAISSVVKNPGWADLSDKHFVLLGAGSAMGPFSVLMSLGANVIAVDLDRPGIWKRLIGIAENSCGTLTFPLREEQEKLTNPEDLYAKAGSDLIKHTPEILRWLQGLYPGKPFTVGCYVYLDGEAHVRVALACDAIMKGLTESRQGTSLVYLCTPTDCHVIPSEARKAALDNYNSLTWQNILVLPIRLLGGGKYLARNVEPEVKADNGDTFCIVNGLVVQQGPNYALAKRLQHWRAMVARSQGCVVSSNVAPSTSTPSVVSNKQFAWAFDGVSFFKPMEIFEQSTSNAVMAAILIHDLRNSKSVANPQVQLRNPLELFSSGSFHGGVWRVGYKFSTTGEVSALIHFLKVLRPLIILLLSVVVLGVAFFLRK